MSISILVPREHFLMESICNKFNLVVAVWLAFAELKVMCDKIWLCFLLVKPQIITLPQDGPLLLWHQLSLWERWESWPFFGIRTTAHTPVTDSKALSGGSGLLSPCLAISKSAANYNTPGYFSHKKKNASYQTHISKACSCVIDGLHPYLSTSPCTSLLPLWDISREEATSEARPAFRAYRWRPPSVRYLWEDSRLRNVWRVLALRVKCIWIISSNRTQQIN